MQSFLGKGHYGHVYCCSSPHATEPFAVKVFVPNSYTYGSAGHMQRLLNEVGLSLTLNHPNLVQTFSKGLVGGAWPAIAMELMAFSLHAFLHRRERHWPSITRPRQLQIATDVACGLAHLHDVAQLMHRDVKPLNVLLDKEGASAKLADFGLATRVCIEDAIERAQAGTLRYMAPEVTLRAYNAKADTFSFAMLLWELLHVEVPFKRLTELQVVMTVQASRRPPIKLPASLEALRVMITACWHQEGLHRPKMRAVYDELRQMDCATMDQAEIVPHASPLGFRSAQEGLSSSQGGSAAAAGSTDAASGSASHHTAKLGGPSTTWQELAAPAATCHTPTHEQP